MGILGAASVSDNTMVIQLTTHVEVGGSIPGKLTFRAGATTVVGGLGSEPPTHKHAIDCLALDRCAFCRTCSPNCLKPSLSLEKNPNCVFLTACLLARLTV